MRHVLPMLAAALVGLQLPEIFCQAPETSQPFIFSSQTSVVIVPALVRTRAGALVFTLKADDFVLTDDGVPQKLTLEQDTGGEPLALVVVVEIGGAGAREFDQLGPLAPMLEAVVGNVPRKLAVVAFDSEPRLVQRFSPRIEDAVEAVRNLTPGCTREHHQDFCQSPTARHDAIQADNGAAILDSVGFAVGLLRNQPQGYRRAILLVSETLDRGSRLTLEQAVHAVSDTNTSIYSVGFSTAKSEAVHYASRQLPINAEGGGLRFENPYPNPPHGCMGKDPDPDPDGAHNKLAQLYDCLVQLAPPLGLAKMAALAANDALRRNVPETVAHLTGGEYFKLTDARSLERDLGTIANHLPNRYVLSFHPQSPHPGLHVISVRLPAYANLGVTARSSYWANPEVTAATGTVQ
jgi:VWFA-related protein